MTEGYIFTIEHIDYETFYITVASPDGCYCYDGYWHKLDASIEEALKEAINGCKLKRRKFR